MLNRPDDNLLTLRRTIFIRPKCMSSNMAEQSHFEIVKRTAEHLGHEKIKLQGELETTRTYRNKIELSLEQNNYELDNSRDVCTKLSEMLGISNCKLAQSQVKQFNVNKLTCMHRQIITFTNKICSLTIRPIL